MEEINVTLGYSPHNEKHCSDGDSCYLNGLFCADQRFLSCIKYEKEEELNTSKAIANFSVQLLQSR